MGLTKQDIAELIHTRKPQHDVMDIVFKGISTLALALILWIFSTTNQLKQDVEVIKNNDKWTTEMMTKFREYSEKPRFTNDDFSRGVTPLIDNINKNTTELNKRKELYENIRNRLVRLEVTNETR